MDITVAIAGRRHGGWKSASVTRSLETVAGVFKAVVSERSPGLGPRDIRPGDACTVAIAGDQVIAGHLDSVRTRYDAAVHEIEFGGRDATADLVDCSAPSDPGEWLRQPLQAIAAALAGPFRVPVRVETDTSPVFRKFRVEEGETAFEALERLCRMRGVLPFADGAGGIVVGRPARSRAGVRLARGVNVLSGEGVISHADRYSTYRVLGQQPGNDFLGVEESAHVLAEAFDRGVRRRRPLTLLAEQAVDTDEARRRAEWEASVRAARSRRATYVVQGWREGRNGPLWAPGRLVHVDDDWLGLRREMLIGSTTHEVSSAGTVTTLGLYLPGAFLPEPAVAEDPGEETGWWG